MADAASDDAHPQQDDGSEATPPSYLLRVSLALLFAWSFRLMVIGVVGAFVLAPFWIPDDVSLLARVAAHVITIGGGLYALRALLFIQETFQPPEAAVPTSTHAALHALIAEVANELGTPAPREVFLLPDVNAYVREPTRWLGLKRDRILYVGVGLLNVNSVSQMRATFAHELAHFVGGDTKLELMLARTRAGLTNLLMELQGGPLFYPFAVYGAVFFALSQQVSRAQELWADRAAVRIAGRRAQIEGLRRSAVGDVLLRRILERGAPFLLLAGRQPKDAYRFLRAAESGSERDDLRSEVHAALHERPSEMFDSHPSLSERMTAAEKSPEPDEVRLDDRLGRALLDDPEAVEVAFTRHLLGAQAADVPVAATDADLLDAVTTWLSTTAAEGRKRAAEWFGAATAVDDDAALHALLRMAARSEGAPADASASTAAMGAVLRDALVAPVGALLSMTLVDAGGTIEIDLVDEVLVRVDDKLWLPFDRVRAALQSPAIATELLDDLASLRDAHGHGQEQDAGAASD